MNRRVVKLGEACEFIRGVTFEKNDASNCAGHGRTPILRAGNIGDELDIQNDLVWVPDALVDDRQLLRKNDIAICMSSGSSDVVGKTGRIGHSLKASVGSFCGIIRPTRADEAGFLSFFFRSSQFRKHRDSIARGANIQNLRFSQFEEIELSIPQDAEHIAAILERADRLRRLRRYALDRSKSMRWSIYLEMFDSPGKSFPETQLQEIADSSPYSLSSGPFGSSLTSADYVSEGVMVLRGLNVGADGVCLDERKFVSEAKARDLARSEVRPGDIVIVAVGSSGLACEVSTGVPRAIMSQNFNKITPDPTKVNRTYLQYCLNSQTVQSRLRQEITDTVRTFLSLTKLKAVKIPLAPLALQNQFAALIKDNERLISLNRESVRQAEHLFQTLLHRAFTSGL